MYQKTRLYLIKKQNRFRKLKEIGKINPEQFDKEQLEQLGILLIKFCESFKNVNRVLTAAEQFAIIEVEHVIDTVDLLLSENTEYGYLDKFMK